MNGAPRLIITPGIIREQEKRKRMNTMMLVGERWSVEDVCMEEYTRNNPQQRLESCRHTRINADLISI